MPSQRFRADIALPEQPVAWLHECKQRFNDFQFSWTQPVYVKNKHSNGLNTYIIDLAVSCGGKTYSTQGISCSKHNARVVAAREARRQIVHGK